MKNNLKLNIFNSNFELRAHLKKKEPIIQKQWINNKLIQKIITKGNKKFIFHSGPPYANGNIHIGHALNIILKDFWLRYYAMNDYQSIYLPGWDTHGLPIALKVIKKNGQKIQKKDIFRQKCRQFAATQIAIQKKQFQRLGLLIDFSNKYVTFDRQYIKKQLEIFGKMVNQNLIFQSWKPIFWSWSSKTALADTEVIYLPKKSQSIFITFPLISEQKKFKNTFLLVWTTTPWTIPENRFLAVNKNFTYLLLKKDAKQIIVNQERWEKIKKDQTWKIIKKIFGKDLCDLKYQHPYLEYNSKILHSNHVNKEEGTGIVHIAPSFGLEDFNLTKDFFKITSSPIDENGFFNLHCKDKTLQNIFYEKSEAKVILQIKKNKNLFAIKEITHAYPHDWRTKKPVIYRTTKQWYLNLKPLHQKILKNIANIKMNPKWGKKRLSFIIEKRTDWCLSRQRKWGVPIPIFFDKQKKPILKENLIIHVASLIEKHGDDIWWNWNLDALLPKEDLKKYQIVSRCYDTFDVWFDSGCSAQINYHDQKIDAICEGTDQFRGWFNSLMIINTICENNNLKKIFTHGFVNDADGKKMSKSLGNVVDPLQICEKFGADVLRLWVASCNFHEDLNLSEKLIQEISKSYIKIRNTMRFLINNLVDFDLKKHKTKTFPLIDQCILKTSDLFIKKTQKNYQAGNFHLFYLDLISFINNDLSNNYFAYAKNILYIEKLENKRRRQIQNVFYLLLEKLLILLAPIMPHSTEEGYQKANLINKKESIHLLSFEDLKNTKEIFKHSEEKLLKTWKMLLNLKNDCNYLNQNENEKNKEKGIIIKIIFNQNYKLFKNETEHQKFLNDCFLKIINKDQYKVEKIQKNLQEIEDLNLFLQTYKIIFEKSQKLAKTSLLGKYQKSYLEIKKCERCWFQEKQQDQKYCIKCTKIIIEK